MQSGLVQIGIEEILTEYVVRSGRRRIIRRIHFLNGKEVPIRVDPKEEIKVPFSKGGLARIARQAFVLASQEGGCLQRERERRLKVELQGYSGRVTGKWGTLAKRLLKVLQHRPLGKELQSEIDRFLAGHDRQGSKSKRKAK